jgi:hypothetical protein
MTRPSAASAPRRGGATTATATAVLAATGVAAWSWLLDRSLVGIAPLAAVAAVAAVAVLLAAGRLSGRLAGVLLVLWLPAAVLAVGAPAGQLLPPAWPLLVAHLGGGAQWLTAPAGAPTAMQPWPLAAWLLGAGAVWIAGAVLAALGAASVWRRAIAFGVLAAPWVAAVIVGAVVAHHNDRAAWQGAAILLAGLLWFADRRYMRPAVALGLAVALISVATAQAVGPRTRWFTSASPSGAAASLRFLEVEPTYGPLQARRSGATMLEVTAAVPALWRMRVLTLFFGPGWRIGSPLAELPQPAAAPVEVSVGVRGLQSDLMIAPGRIDAVHAAHGTPSQGAGEAWQLTPSPRHGDTYHIRASVVHASAQQLRGAPPPTDPRLRPYTRLTSGYDAHSIDIPLYGQPPDPSVAAALQRTPYRPVATLARQLAAGTTSQWEMVARVHRYLLGGGRFRYTTKLPQPGPYPLVDFLLRDHAGDCQHFAGAAGLLLRLAGVPTRVVAGFATGLRQRDGRFQVRDVDAHTWIEVYFQGYGWVAFDPTPAAAQAHIPRQLDPLAPTPPATAGGRHGDNGPGGPGGLVVGAILAALATGGAVITRRRRQGRHAEFGQLLEALVRRTGGHIQTSSTLADLGVQLARLVGLQTAALATHAERARFSPHPSTPATRPRMRIAQALARDLGPIRALTVLVVPAATRRLRNRPPQTG